MYMAMDWTDYFRTDGSRLFWIEHRPVSHFPSEKERKRWVARYGGKEAGSLSGSGYVEVKLLGRKLGVHRILWEMHNGPIPDGMEMDHINRNRADNSLSNLRAVSKSDNMHNRASWGRSKYKGVYWDARSGLWRAQITINKVKRSLGRYHSEEEAYAAYCSAAIAHYGSMTFIE